MESLTIKLDTAMLNAIEESMKPLYATKTEFVREALRKHIEDIKKEKVLANLRANMGKYKDKKTSDERLREIKKQAFEEYLKEKGW